MCTFLRLVLKGSGAKAFPSADPYPAATDISAHQSVTLTIDFSRYDRRGLVPHGHVRLSLVAAVAVPSALGPRSLQSFDWRPLHSYGANTTRSPGCVQEN